MAIEQEQVTWYAGIMKRFGPGKGPTGSARAIGTKFRIEASGRGNALLAAGEFAVYIGRGHVAEIKKKKGAPGGGVQKCRSSLVVQPATVQIAKRAQHTNSAKLLVDFLLSDQVAEVLAGNRLPGRSNASGLDPAFKEINADKIFPLSMDEVQTNYRKYLDEFRNYFGK